MKKIKTMKSLVKYLIENNKKISTMESCTGGYIANSITNVEGSSNIFKFGAVTYSNEYKIKMGVNKEVINKLIKDNNKRIDEIPFDFARRRLSVIVSDGQKTQMITKGAVEEILGISTMVDYQGNVSPITNAIKENIKI